MPKINFVKMVASGNDFVVVSLLNETKNILRASKNYPSRLSSKYNFCESRRIRFLARQICDRKFGIGADGLLLIDKSKVADIKMRIFNADGSEAEMCGNGARCVALWAKSKVTHRLRRGQASQKSKVLKIETKAGIINAEAKGDKVTIKLTDPAEIKLGITIKVNNRNLKVNFINTGVPHAVIFVEGLDEMHVSEIGRSIRYHKKFFPAGVNVNFVEVLSADTIAVRTYERGVEDETLACGTGSVAAALLATYNLRLATSKINVLTKSGETLKVYFRRQDNKFSDVWLEGRARIVYGGTYNV